MNKPAKIEKPSGVIDIRGKQYQTVAFRVQQFREAHPDWALTTSLMARDAECVVMQAAIADEQGRILATGHAEENRKASQINRTSALENAETSAIGRALAALGFGGTEFATANEVQNAIHQQNEPDIGTGEEPPAQRQQLEGPYKSPTALKAAIKAFAESLRVSQDDLAGFNAWMETEEVIELEKQALRYLPSWWDTGEGMPSDFEPISSRIQRKKKELEELESIANSPAAKMVRAG